jgi:signal transduction histidine kinase
MPFVLDQNTAAPGPQPRLWMGYALAGLLGWLLYGVASTDWQRGSRTLLDGLYEATWNLGPALLLGPAVWPWVRGLATRGWPWRARFVAHAVAAVLFVLCWQALQALLASALFGVPHALAELQQSLVWRSVWGVVLYAALVFGFGNVLLTQRAHEAALRSAQAEAALVRAELAAINGKLNPHFLFNTLNSLLMLTRAGPDQAGQAERGLMAFSKLMRYVLDSNRVPDSRVPLREELDFVRHYLALEQLRLGPRLKVHWELDPAADNEAVPPLTLQPLVENAVAHGLAPQREGGELRLATRSAPEGLHLRVQDNGAGSTWPPPPKPGRGTGLAALQRRFELDYCGRARLAVHTAPGAGFDVQLFIPRQA